MNVYIRNYEYMWKQTVYNTKILRFLMLNGGLHLNRMLRIYKFKARFILLFRLSAT